MPFAPPGAPSSATVQPSATPARVPVLSSAASAGSYSAGVQPSTPARVSVLPPKPEARPARHLVQKGETLFSLSARYGVSVKELKQWNKLKGKQLKYGQRLRLEP